MATLTATDLHLARVVAIHRHPGFWHREPGFQALLLFILEQQVSLESGRAAFARLQVETGGITPSAVLSLDDGTLRRVGFSRQKTRYARLLSRAVLDGFDLDGLARLPEAEARAVLLSLTGVGPWTADVYLLSCLRRPDVWPVGDRALQVAAAEVLELAKVPNPVELEALGERWRPHRATAARLLWHAYLSKRGRSDI